MYSSGNIVVKIEFIFLNHAVLLCVFGVTGASVVILVFGMLRKDLS